MTLRNLQAAAPRNITEANQPGARATPEDDEGAGHSIGRALETIKELTGLTAEQIRAGFRADPPQTLAEQAEAEGVGRDELIAAIIADTRPRLERAVAGGTITRERADARLADLDATVTELVEKRWR